MERSNKAAEFLSRVRETELMQACKCGTILRATRAAFDTVAHGHFTNDCVVIRKLGGQSVRPVWGDWAPFPVMTALEWNTRSTTLIRSLRFSAPYTAPAWSTGIASIMMIEPVFIDLQHDLSDAILARYETVVHNAMLRMLHKTDIQHVVRTLLGFLENESDVTKRAKEVTDMLHRVALGHYG